MIREGLACTRLNNKWGYLDKSGAWATEDIGSYGDEASATSSVAVGSSGHVHVFISKHTWFRHCDCDFDECCYYDNSLKLMRAYKYNGTWAFEIIDSDDWPSDYPEATGYLSSGVDSTDTLHVAYTGVPYGGLGSTLQYAKSDGSDVPTKNLSLDFLLS